MGGGGDPPTPPPDMVYVATDGNDENNGTIASPFATLTKAAKTIVGGGAIYLRGGVYDQVLPEDIPNGALVEAPTLVSGYAGEQAILMPLSGVQVARFGNTKTKIKLADIVLDGTNVSGDGCKINDAQYITLSNVEIRSAPNQGALITGVELLLENCEIHHNGTNGLDHGIYMQSGTITIRGCNCHHNTGHGIHAYNGVDASVFLIEQNTVSNNDYGIGVYYGQATVRQNTCDGNSYNIAARYNIFSAVIEGNVVQNATVAGLVLQSLLNDNALVTIRNNTLTNNPIDLRIRGADNNPTAMAHISDIAVEHVTVDPGANLIYEIV